MKSTDNSTPNTQGASWELNWKALAQHKLEVAGFPAKTQAEVIIALEPIIDFKLSKERAEGERRERERAVQMAHYWSIEITAESSAQADIGVNEVETFRQALRFLKSKLESGEATPVELEQHYFSPQEPAPSDWCRTCSGYFTDPIHIRGENHYTLPADSTEDTTNQ